MYTFISMNASLLLGAYAKKDKKKKSCYIIGVLEFVS